MTSDVVNRAMSHRERCMATSSIAAAVPAVFAAIALVMFAGAELAGHTWFSPGPERNLAEAAAMGRVSEVARLLRAGEDPRRVVEVRPHAISSSVRRVTALEAAVWHRSAPLMALFDRAGTIADPSTRHDLACLASDLKVEEIVRYLQPDGRPACVPDQALQAVLARSHPSGSEP
jgi:hypothetical protein